MRTDAPHEKPLRIINSVAPIRICDNGGWTDTWFAQHGKIFNIGVFPYAEVQLKVFASTSRDRTVTIVAENFGQSYSRHVGKAGWDHHPLLEAAIERMRLPRDLSFRATIFSEAPSGASTGTSAAVSVALIGALDRLASPSQHMTPLEVARTAHAVETEMLHLQCGIQDQLCSAFGGINYIDTAAGYGDGHSETLIGRVMRTRRDECYLATKVAYNVDKAAVIRSCEDSLRRLQTDHIDIFQFHGGRFTAGEIEHILHGGPMEGMLELKRRGLIRHIGFTVEEPWTALPLIASGQFETAQVCYNLIRQSAGYHLLDAAHDACMGVCCMRPLTSGIFQRQLETLAPQWLEKDDVNRVLMAFLLSDSRVHMIPVGMRWEREVRENIAFVESFVPTADMAAVPRMTQHVYETDDARHGMGTKK